MARLPACLNTRSLKRQGAKNLHAELRRQFGWSLLPGDNRDDGFVPDWSAPFICDALAREALLWYSIDEWIPPGWLPAIAKAQPIEGSDDSFEDLAKGHWVSALFPVDTGNGNALAGIVWVEASGRILIEPPGVVGDSWHLAAEIAREALARNASSVVKRRIAAELIFSGAVTEGKVAPVHAGHKSSLGLPARIWIVPERGWQGGDANPVGTVADAWAIAADEWTRNEAEVAAWPNGVDVLHSFTSKALGPPIEAILCSRPKQVHLWVSEMKDAARSAALIAGFFDSNLPEPFHDYCPEFIVHDVSSRNISVIEQQLGKVIDSKQSGERLIFNITTGNRLQGIAASNVVRLLRKKNGFLVYKDIDNRRLGEMVCISYDLGNESPKSQLFSAGEQLRCFSSDAFQRFGFAPNTLDELRNAFIFGKFRESEEK